MIFMIVYNVDSRSSGGKIIVVANYDPPGEMATLEHKLLMATITVTTTTRTTMTKTTMTIMMTTTTTKLTTTTQMMITTMTQIITKMKKMC